MSRLAPLLGSPAGRATAGALGALLLLTVAGLLALWPYGEPGFSPAISQDTERAEVVGITSEGCDLVAPSECRRLLVELKTGPDADTRHGVTLPEDELTPDVDIGDQVRVQNTLTSGIDPDLRLELPEGGLGEDVYVFVEFERKAPLYLLALIFAVLVVGFARRRGALSLVGLAVALLLVVEFVLPAIVDGKPPLLVALVGALAVMFATIPLTHGVGVKSAAAMLGTAGSLILIALLAVLFVEIAHITGLASEEATLLRSGTGGDLSPSGLVLAGIVIGALGVLDDVTVSQASTVMALRRANPAQRARELYSGAIAVGRDHLGAAVNTLVLAYVGAALPVLLIFTTQGTGFLAAINRETVAGEIVATLVGSIGLIAALPITTGLSALLAERLPADTLPADGHTH
jgi:uncharacterized membrane protein